MTTATYIVVMGNSSGGYTAAALAGITLDIKQMYGYSAPSSAKTDLGCSYGENESPKQLKPISQKINSGFDSRVTRIIMLDSALGPAATITSLKNVKLPTLIIGSQQNDFLPFEHHAKY